MVLYLWENCFTSLGLNRKRSIIQVVSSALMLIKYQCYIIYIWAHKKGRHENAKKYFSCVTDENQQGMSCGGKTNGLVDLILNGFVYSIGK